MIPGLKGTKTEANLTEALQKECLAVTEYTWHAHDAAKAGYQEISEVYLDTARNESEHARMWMKWLSPTDNDTPADLLTNLVASTDEEHYEGTEMYPGFAEVAKQEGFADIAREFRGVSLIEQAHNSRFNQIINEVKTSTVFERPEPVLWQCMKCGHLQKTKAAPQKCPVCGNGQEWFRAYPVDFFDEAPNVPDQTSLPE